MLDPVFRKGYQLLDDLNAQGVIPKAAVPVLQERLSLENVFVALICPREATLGAM